MRYVAVVLRYLQALNSEMPMKSEALNIHIQRVAEHTGSVQMWLHCSEPRLVCMRIHVVATRCNALSSENSGGSAVAGEMGMPELLNAMKLRLDSSCENQINASARDWLCSN